MIKDLFGCELKESDIIVYSTSSSREGFRIAIVARIENNNTIKGFAKTFAGSSFQQAGYWNRTFKTPLPTSGFMIVQNPPDYVRKSLEQSVEDWKKKNPNKEV